MKTNEAHLKSNFVGAKTCFSENLRIKCFSPYSKAKTKERRHVTQLTHTTHGPRSTSRMFLIERVRGCWFLNSYLNMYLLFLVLVAGPYSETRSVCFIDSVPLNEYSLLLASKGWVAALRIRTSRHYSEWRLLTLTCLDSRSLPLRTKRRQFWQKKQNQ